MATKAGQRRHRGIRRWVLAGIAVLILGPVAAIGVLLARFDPNTYKPEIEAAIARASGRQVALNGPISLRLSLQPAIRADDVVIANPPGFSRPEMASLGRLDVKVALLPLLGGRVEIRRLVLVRPDVTIETNGKGQSNFSLGPGGPRAAASSRVRGRARQAGAEPKRRVALAVGAVRIEDGTVSWRDDRNGAHGVLRVPNASVSAAARGAATIEGTARYRGATFHLHGTVGALSRLADQRPGPAWPVDLVLTADGAKLSLDGSFTDPARLQGGRFRVAASVPALQRFAALLPRWKVPALNDVKLTADVATNGRGWPAVSNVSLDVGRSDLGSLRPGLVLAAASVRAPSLDQPCKLDLAGTLGASPLALEATLGPPARLLPRAFDASPNRAAWPVAIQAKAAGAHFSVSGTIGQPRTLGEADLAVSARIPELAELGGIAGRRLPALRQVSFSGQLADGAGGWRRGIRLSTFSLSLPAAEVSGEARLTLAGARPAVAASLAARRVDLDTLRNAFGRKEAAKAAVAAPPAHADPSPPRQWAIPDTKLPFGLLKVADAEIAFTVQSLTYGGSEYRDVQGKLSVRDGRATLDPLAAETPAGHVAMTAAANASAATPSVALTLAAPTLAVAPLLRSFGMAAVANGTLAVDASLHGTGESAHAIATDASGEVGVAMTGGSVDRRLAGKLLDEVLRAARIAPELLGGGRGAVRCLAFRLDAVRGTGTVKTLLLDMARLRLTGAGSVAFGPETLALRLEPELTVGANRLAVPVRVGGTFLAPKFAAEPAGAVASAAALAAGHVKRGSALGQLLGVLAQAAPRPSRGPSCEQALALARFGRAGPPHRDPASGR